MADIIEKPSPNFDERGGVSPSMILLHYTGMPTAQDALERLTDAESKVSAHYTIDQDGTLYRHVEEDKRAWHAGDSFWRGTKNINAHSIGIEIVNPGHEWGYCEFPSSQISRVMELCSAIKKRHEIEYVLGHSDVAPARKEDPGELFPWKLLAQNGIGVWPEISDEDMVKAAGMDVVLALGDYGYDISQPDKAILAFQRHFLPEIFEQKTQGSSCSRTRAKLYALLAGHLLYKEKV